MKFKFKEVTESDFKLLHRWVNTPHVSERWDGDVSQDQVRNQFSKKIKASYVFPHIVYMNSEPIGFIQSYIANEVGEGWWPNELPGTWGVDQFIGVEDLLGKGIGSAFVKQFTDELLAMSKVKKVITDPAPDNLRAIKAYRKAGFKDCSEMETPDGPALIMEKI